jgi:eukaryotic-like serine/threonine-protein kinase
MGVVYRAVDERLNRPAAIKILASDATTGFEGKMRFDREARAASALNHPNIVTVYDIDSVDGMDFIVMEYIEGQTLDAAIGNRPLPVRQALAYATQIADALACAHAAGIVHRDLKPANVIVGTGGTIKILNFGVAKLAEPEGGADHDTAPTMAAARTEVGTIVGTSGYMSPEQIQGQTVDHRSDVFAFGAVLYEILTGRKAFPGENRVSVLSAVLEREPEPLAASSAGVPQEFQRIVSRCLKKDANLRFQHTLDLKLALIDVGVELAREPAGAAAPDAIRRRTVPAWALIVAAGCVGVALGAAPWWLRPASAPEPFSTLSRVTSDAGLSGDPALSFDGKTVAYASDRGSIGRRSIWVEQINSGGAIPRHAG